jgi:hypothetical protein
MGMDAHAWVVDKNGNIIDPDFEDYKLTKELMDLTEERCYEAFNTEKQIDCAKYIKGRTDALKKLHGDNYDNWLDKFYKEPVSGYCWYNALAYKKHNPECKIVFGKFGWKKQNGEPYWEWGDEDLKSKGQDIKNMYNQVVKKMKGMTQYQKEQYLRSVIKAYNLPIS